MISNKVLSTTTEIFHEIFHFEHSALTLILLFTTTPTFANSVDPNQMAFDGIIEKSVG